VRGEVLGSRGPLLLSSPFLHGLRFRNVLLSLFVAICIPRRGRRMYFRSLRIAVNFCLLWHSRRHFRVSLLLGNLLRHSSGSYNFTLRSRSSDHRCWRLRFWAFGSFRRSRHCIVPRVLLRRDIFRRYEGHGGSGTFCGPLSVGGHQAVLSVVRGEVLGSRGPLLLSSPFLHGLRFRNVLLSLFVAICIPRRGRRMYFRSLRIAVNFCLLWHSRRHFRVSLLLGNLLRHSSGSYNFTLRSRSGDVRCWRFRFWEFGTCRSSTHFIIPRVLPRPRLCQSGCSSFVVLLLRR